MLRYFVGERAQEVASGRLKNKTRGAGAIRPPPNADKPVRLPCLPTQQHVWYCIGLM